MSKMYALSGVSSVIELGKNGYHVQYDSVNGWVEILQSDGSTLGRLQVAEPVANSDASTKLYVDTQISNLIDSSPETLNTLNEIAAALNDDPDFYTTITNMIALKADQTTVDEIDANVNDLITLSGEPENATSHADFTGNIIPNGATTRVALQSLETHVTEMEHGCRRITFDTIGGTSVNIGAVVPTNMAVTSVRVKVTTPWDGAAPTMQIGTSGDTDLLAGTAHFDLKDANAETQLVNTFYETSGDTQFIVTLDHDSSTAGEAKLLLDMCEIM